MEIICSLRVPFGNYFIGMLFIYISFPVIFAYLCFTCPSPFCYPYINLFYTLFLFPIFQLPILYLYISSPVDTWGSQIEAVYFDLKIILFF
jgi:hypothetical protein